MFQKFIGFFTSESNISDDEKNNNKRYNKDQIQQNNVSSSKDISNKPTLSPNGYSGQSKQNHTSSSNSDINNNQNRIPHRKMSIQEQQQIKEKITIYEQQFSDFLIMYDTKQVIKTLDNRDWNDIITKKSIEGVSPERIQFSLLKGIPYDIRKDVWIILSKVEELKKTYPNFSYENMSKIESQSDKIILKDLNRTFTDMKFFQQYDKFDKKYEGREKLFRVLRAYSHFDKEIGYTQGMNFIVASLLVLMNPENEKEIEEVVIINKEYEENIFWILVHIMQHKNWRVLFLDGTPGIHQMIKNLENKMIEFIPNIHKHIQDVGLDCFTCFSQYFFTILLYNAPKTVQKRILDLFLFEGEQVLYSVIIKMLTLCSDIILNIWDMQKMMEFCRKGILDECHKIFKEEKKKGDIQFGEFRFNIAKISDLDFESSNS